MKILFRAAILAALTLLAACASTPRTNPLTPGAVEQLTISEIEVVTGAAYYDSARARAFKPRLKADLTSRLGAEFSARLSPTGDKLVVEIAQLNVTDSRRAAFGSDRNVMNGTLRIISTRTGTVRAVYDIEVTTGEEAKTATGALIRTAIDSADKFYATMVEDFARQARSRVLQ